MTKHRALGGICYTEQGCARHGRRARWGATVLMSARIIMHGWRRRAKWRTIAENKIVYWFDVTQCVYRSLTQEVPPVEGHTKARTQVG